MKRISMFSDRLKEFRETNNLTLSDISEKTGLPAQTINRYELGQRAPKIDTAVSIAESLRINPLWLQGYDVSVEEVNPPAQVDEGIWRAICADKTKLSVAIAIAGLSRDQANQVAKVLSAILDTEIQPSGHR